MWNGRMYKWLCRDYSVYKLLLIHTCVGFIFDFFKIISISSADKVPKHVIDVSFGVHQVLLILPLNLYSSKNLVSSDVHAFLFVALFLHFLTANVEPIVVACSFEIEQIKVLLLLLLLMMLLGLHLLLLLLGILLLLLVKWLFVHEDCATILLLSLTVCVLLLHLHRANSHYVFIVIWFVEVLHL